MHYMHLESDFILTVEPFYNILHISLEALAPLVYLQYL